jgi:hypothetical protein
MLLACIEKRTNVNIVELNSDAAAVIQQLLKPIDVIKLYHVCIRYYCSESACATLMYICTYQPRSTAEIITEALIYALLVHASAVKNTVSEH